MAIAFPYDPDWSQPVQFTKSFKTARSTSRYKLRQRSALRTTPLVTIEYTTQFNGQESSDILHKLRKNTNQLFSVPDWRINRIVTDLSDLPASDGSGDTVTYVEFDISDKTDYQAIEAGDRVIIWQSPSVYYAATVDATGFDSSTITLELDATYSLSGSGDDDIYCFKAFTCYPTEVKLQWITDTVCEGSITWVEASETALNSASVDLDCRNDPDGPDDGGEICEPCLISGEYLAYPMFDTPCGNPSEERPAFRAKDVAPPQTFFIRFDKNEISQNAGHSTTADLTNMIDALDGEWELGFVFPYTWDTSTSRHWNHVKAGNSSWFYLEPTVSRWLWRETREYTGGDGGTYTLEVRLVIEHDEDQSPGETAINNKKGAWGSLLNIYVFSDEIASYTDGTTHGDGYDHYRDDPCIGRSSAPYKYAHPQLAATWNYRTSLTAGCSQSRDLYPDDPVSVDIGYPWDGATVQDAKYNSCYGSGLGSDTFFSMGMVHYGTGAWDVSLKIPNNPRLDIPHGHDAITMPLTVTATACYTMSCLQVPDELLDGLDKYSGAGTDVGDFDGCDGHDNYQIGGTSRTIVIPGYDAAGGACYKTDNIKTITVNLQQSIDREKYFFATNNCIRQCPEFDNPWRGSEGYGLKISRCNYDWLFPAQNRKDLRWEYVEEDDWQNNGNPYEAEIKASLGTNGWNLNPVDVELTPLFLDDPDIDAILQAPNDCFDVDCPCNLYSVYIYDAVSFVQFPEGFNCPGEGLIQETGETRVFNWTGDGPPDQLGCQPDPDNCLFYWPSVPLTASVITVNDSIAGVPTTKDNELIDGTKGLTLWTYRWYDPGFDGDGNDCCDTGGES